MTEPKTLGTISIAATFAVILGAAALVLIPVAAGMYPFALILGFAAIILGSMAALNARSGPPISRWIALVGILLGAVAAILVGVLTLS